MSSLIDLPSNSSTSQGSPSTRSMWVRLLWKDAREVVPIWITLLSAGILCLIITGLMVNNGRVHIAPLFISAHTFIALCSVITGVYLLANEDENRTLHLLRNLPLPPKQIVWQKLLLGSVGVVVLAFIIAAVTLTISNFVQCAPLGSNSPYGFSVANIVLLPLLYLVIALLCAMVSRSHFYGVLLAGSAAFALVTVLEPTWLGASAGRLNERGEIRWLFVALGLIGGCCCLIANATGWIEEKAISKSPLKSHDSQKTLSGRRGPKERSTSSTAPNPFPALLWQSFRQSRYLIACCLFLTIAGWLAAITWVNIMSGQPGNPPASESAPIKTMLTFGWMLAMITLFASSISLDDKRHDNYLFFQQNRERSKWLWLSRLLPYLGLALLVSLLWHLFIFDLDANPFQNRSNLFDPRSLKFNSSMGLQAASQSFLVPVLALLGIIGIGQYFSMFVRNPILSFVFTSVVSIVFAGLFAYVVYVNESIWLYVVPVVAAPYMATWWRTKSWLASSPYKTAFLIPLALPVIALAIVAAAFANHRATEYQDVRLNPNNYAEWLHGKFHTNKRSILDIGFGDETQRQQAAKLYTDAAEAYQGVGFGLMEATQRMPWPAQKTADFVTKNQLSIENILAAAQIPVCAPFLSAEADTRQNQQWALQQLALVNSHHQLLQGDLTAAKHGIDAYDRVNKRAMGEGMSGGRPYLLTRNRYDLGYYGLLLAWADHPKQKLNALKAAVAQLEGLQSDIRPTKLADYTGDLKNNPELELAAARVYREFGGEQTFMNLQYEIADLQQDNSNHILSEFSQNFRLMPWEYQRMLKVGQLAALRRFDRAQTFILRQSLRNDSLVKRNDLESELIRTQFQPEIPIEEDRIVGFPMYSMSWDSYFIGSDILNRTNWRRYALLRLGLAAYKIEHDKYPDELGELETYYANGLPKTSDGLMFGWFKSGLEHDLIAVSVYNQAEKGKAISLENSRLFAPRKLPLLLPFAIDKDNPLPEPTKYENEKTAINIKELTNQGLFRTEYDTHSYYRATWTVGSKSNEVSD